MNLIGVIDITNSTYILLRYKNHELSYFKMQHINRTAT